MEQFMHWKARIFNLFGKTNEAIKVLKKVAKKRHTSDYVSSFTLYLIGFLYKNEDNLKEAVKWFKKVFIDLPERSLSLNNEEIHVIFKIKKTIKLLK